jgi:hypothetical protein
VGESESECEYECVLVWVECERECECENESVPSPIGWWLKRVRVNKVVLSYVFCVVVVSACYLPQLTLVSVVVMYVHATLIDVNASSYVFCVRHGMYVHASLINVKGSSYVFVSSYVLCPSWYVFARYLNQRECIKRVALIDSRAQIGTEEDALVLRL